MYNVTLAVERAGEMISGVVYDPTRDEMFAAERGSGATLNGEPIRVSHAARLEEALVATGFPSFKRHLNVNVHFYYQLALLSHGVRRGGAAALDLAYVSCGRLDAFWEIGLKPWDQAAGILLVQEAGGRVTDMNGDSTHLTGPHIVVDNAAIHDELIAAFDAVRRGDLRFPMVQFG